MNNSQEIAVLSFIFSIGSMYADSYDAMVNAIKQSDYSQIKEIGAAASFSEREKYSFISFANERIAECKKDIEHRKACVAASTLLKVTAPLTSFVSLIIGTYLDPRGVGAFFAVPTAIISPAALAILIAPVLEKKDDKLTCVGMSIGGLAAIAATYGLIKLEKYFWRRASQLDRALQQSLEKALDCKVVLMSVLDAGMGGAKLKIS